MLFSSLGFVLSENPDENLEMELLPAWFGGLFNSWALGFPHLFFLLFYWTTEGFSMLDDCVL